MGSFDLGVGMAFWLMKLVRFYVLFMVLFIGIKINKKNQLI